MDHKSIRRLGTSLLCCASLGAAGIAHARSVQVDGIVVLEDGSPIAGGTIVVREIVNRKSARGMPYVHPVSVVPTNRDGKFQFKLEDVQGSIDVELVPDHCDWTVAVTEIKLQELLSKDHFDVRLEPKRETCKR